MNAKGKAPNSFRLGKRTASEPKLDPRLGNIAKFNEPKGIIQKMEQSALAKMLTGNEFLDKHALEAVRKLKNSSQQSIKGTKDLKYITQTRKFEGISMEKPKFIEIPVRPGRVGIRQVPPPPIKQSGQEDVEPGAAQFFTRLKKAGLLKAADDHVEKVVQSALDKKDYGMLIDGIDQINSTLLTIFAEVANTDEDTDLYSVALFMDICTKKLNFVQKAYKRAFTEISQVSSQGLASNQRLGLMEASDPKSLSEFGHDLTNDIKYFMRTLEDQLAYYVAKMKEFTENDEGLEATVSAAYENYNNNKTMLEFKAQNKQFQRLIEKLEGILEDWIRSLLKEKREVSRLMLENKKLQMLIEETAKTVDSERATILDLQDKLKERLGPDLTQIRREFEGNFASVMSNMKLELSKSDADRKSMAANIRDLEEKLAAFTTQKMDRASKNQDVGIQAIFQIGAVKDNTRLFTDTLEMPELAIAKGDAASPNSKAWLCSMINHVINARLAFEFEPMKKGIEPKPMKLFVVECFLIKFGSAQASQHLLSDLIACLKKYSGESERFKIFARFMGLEDALSNEIVRKKKNKGYEDYLTNYYYTSHMAIRDYLEFCMLLKGYDFYEKANLKPFLNFGMNKREQLIPTETAKKIFISFILNRENKQQLDPEILETEFENLVRQDLFLRLHDDKGVEIPSKNVRKDEFIISIDYLAKALLDRRLGIFIANMQSFWSQLTVNPGNDIERELNFDKLVHSCREILPNLNEPYAAHIYREIMDTPHLQAFSIEKMIESAVHSIVLLREKDNRFQLDSLAISREAYDERILMIMEAETRVNQKIKQNLVKKEGRSILILIEGLCEWRDKFIFGSVGSTGNLNMVALKWKFDNLTSLVSLQETYEKIKNRIMIAEKTNDQVARYHGELKYFFTNLNADKLITKTNFDDLASKDQVQWAEEIDTNWKRLRIIICLSFFHSSS